jgi:hypothetical protein
MLNQHLPPFSNPAHIKCENRIMNNPRIASWIGRTSSRAHVFSFYLLALAVMANAPLAAAQPQPSITNLVAATNSPLLGQNDAITITVTSGSLSTSATPTGTIQIGVDGTIVNSSIPLASGSASYTFSSSTPGRHVVTAYYSGDNTYAASTGTLTLSSVQKSFALTATGMTVKAGSSGQSQITITPLNGYTGTISFSVSTLDNITIPCFSAPNATVSGAQPVTVTMTVQTSSSGCNGSTAGFLAPAAGASPGRMGMFAGALGLLLLGCFLSANGRWRGFGRAALLAALGLAITGCGSTSSSIATGTYTLTISGVDKTADIGANTSVVLTID